MQTLQARIEKGMYWQRAWKLVEGCTKVSAGCDHCWSEMETVLRAGHPNNKIKLRARPVLDLLDYSQFSGHILLREDNLDLPLRTRKPTVWAIWNDLYHEDVPDSFRDRAYAVMALCPQHTFLVLTKRAKRMVEYFETIRRYDHHDGSVFWLGRNDLVVSQGSTGGWPLPNVWHGVTAENQAAADERIPHLLRVPGKRFLSIEPMLGQVNLDRIHESGRHQEGGGWDSWESCLNGKRFDPWADRTTDGWPKVDAVLLGGESGKNARPMHPDWARSVRDQCAAAGVPFFFKQWGEWLPGEQTADSGTAYRSCADGSVYFSSRRAERQNFGTHPDRHSGPMITCRVGKRTAGRLLDGRTHDDLPWARERKAVA
jgi:protein gp37